MRKLLVLMALPVLLFAYSGIGGGRGLLRVQSALVEDQAGLTIGFHTGARHPRFAPEGTARAGWILDLIAPEVNYAPVASKYVGLELFGSYGGVGQFPDNQSRDPINSLLEIGNLFGQVVMRAHDLRAGGKVSAPYLPVLKLGFCGAYSFMPREAPDTTWLDPDFVPRADKFAWRGLMTLQFQDLLPAAPNVHLNFGKAGDLTEYMAAVELAGKSATLFAEAVSQVPAGVSNPVDLNRCRVYLTPGVALGSPGGFAIKAAYSLGMADSSPNKILLAVQVGTGLGKRTPAQYGTITGTVVDEITGAAVPAAISFPDHPRLLPLTADPTTGLFEVRKVPVGAVTVEAVAEGYRKQTVPIAVENGRVAQYEFRLKPLVVYGTIAGVVTDAGTGAPLDAAIEFPGSELGMVTTNAADGSFRVGSVPVGAYTVTASARGYVKASQSASVELGKAASVTFTLNPVPTEPVVGTSILTGRVADKKTGAAVRATVSFPGSTVAAVTADSVTGIYKADLLPGQYALQVQAEGYINQVAAIVMEKDKPLVRDFELVKEGMSITLKGIYFDVGKATIRAESREALAGAAKILTENPTIRVEIQGHTDNTGSDELNLTLSDKRAWSVVNYLVENSGIERGRLTAKGYGKTRPVASNDTPEGRQQNRRVEFVILGQTER
jgi:outer membrane protein OmpA-like peptidoglycan-associated protein